MSEHLKRSKYKVGDTVWFVASISHQYQLIRMIKRETADEVECKPANYTPMALIPIPIRGVIVSIYTHISRYSPCSKTYSSAGGYRTSDYGRYVKFTENEDIEYEIECDFYSAIRTTYGSALASNLWPVTTPFVVSFDKARAWAQMFNLEQEQSKCFYHGKLSVPEAFVASDPEEAEIKCHEKNCVVSIWKEFLHDACSRQYHTEDNISNLVNNCVNKGKMILELSKNIHNKKFGGYSEYLDTLKDDDHGKELLCYKYNTLFTIGR